MRSRGRLVLLLNNHLAMRNKTYYIRYTKYKP
jgi:hypothetical protein